MIPKKYQPKGFEILYDDRDVIVGNKSAGLLTVAALWNRTHTVQTLLENFVRKGSPHSKKRVFVVHRLDQATTGILVFAKSEEAQYTLKENWKDTEKIYYAVVHGKMKNKSGTISSYLEQDEDYKVHASRDTEKGKLAHTQYEVLKQTDKFSLLKVNLLTGRKNQIRVHLADEGNPIVGDDKYGRPGIKYRHLALHAFSLSFDHPFSKKRMTFEARVPFYFKQLVPFDF